MKNLETIELYHSGTDRIEKPYVRYGRPDLDFGPGFYLTDIYEQAASWAQKQARKRKGIPLVNIYVLKLSDLLKDGSFKVFNFPSYNEEWLDFIVENRLGHEKWKGYDFIEGGIADDKVIDTIDLYFSDFIDRDEAIRRLQYLVPNNQICILNQRIIDEFLTFKGCKEISK